MLHEISGGGIVSNREDLGGCSISSVHRETSNTAHFQSGKNRSGKNNHDRVIFTFQRDVAAMYCG